VCSSDLGVAAGVGAYYAVPDSWLKVAWGIGVGGVAYWALWQAQAALSLRRAPVVVD